MNLCVIVSLEDGKIVARSLTILAVVGGKIIMVGTCPIETSPTFVMFPPTTIEITKDLATKFPNVRFVTIQTSH